MSDSRDHLLYPSRQTPTRSEVIEEDPRMSSPDLKTELRRQWTRSTDTWGDLGPEIEPETAPHRDPSKDKPAPLFSEPNPYKFRNQTTTPYPVSPTDQQSPSLSQKDSHEPQRYYHQPGARVVPSITHVEGTIQRSESLKRAEELSRGRNNTPDLHFVHPPDKVGPKHSLGSNPASPQSTQPSSFDSSFDRNAEPPSMPQPPAVAHPAAGTFQNVSLDEEREDGVSFSTRYNQETKDMFEQSTSNTQQLMPPPEPSHPKPFEQNTGHCPEMYKLPPDKVPSMPQRMMDQNSRGNRTGLWVCVIIAVILVIPALILGLLDYTSRHQNASISSVSFGEPSTSLTSWTYTPQYPSTESSTMTRTRSSGTSSTTYPSFPETHVKSASSHHAAVSTIEHVVSSPEQTVSDSWDPKKREDTSSITTARQLLPSDGAVGGKSQTTKALPTSAREPLIQRTVFPNSGEKFDGPPVLFQWLRKFGRWQTCIEKAWFIMTFVVFLLVLIVFPVYGHYYHSFGVELARYIKDPSTATGQVINATLADARQGLDDVNSKMDAKFKDEREEFQSEWKWIAKDIEKMSDWFNGRISTLWGEKGEHVEAKAVRSKSDLREPERVVPRIEEVWSVTTSTSFATSRTRSLESTSAFQTLPAFPPIHYPTTAFLTIATPAPTIRPLQMTNDGTDGTNVAKRRCCCVRCVSLYLKISHAVTDCYLGLYMLGGTAIVVAIVIAGFIVYLFALKVYYYGTYVFHNVAAVWLKWHFLVGDPINAAEFASEKAIGVLTKVVPDLLTKVVPDLLTKTVPDLLTKTIPDILTKELPHMLEDMGKGIVSDIKNIIPGIGKGIKDTAKKIGDKFKELGDKIKHKKPGRKREDGPEAVGRTRTASAAIGANATATMTAMEFRIPELENYRLTKRDVPMTSEGERRCTSPSSLVKAVVKKVFGFTGKPLKLFNIREKLSSMSKGEIFSWIWSKIWESKANPVNVYKLKAYGWMGLWGGVMTLLSILFLGAFLWVFIRLAPLLGKVKHVQGDIKHIEDKLGPYIKDPKGAIQNDAKEVLGAGKAAVDVHHRQDMGVMVTQYVTTTLLTWANPAPVIRQIEMTNLAYQNPRRCGRIGSAWGKWKDLSNNAVPVYILFQIVLVISLLIALGAIWHKIKEGWYWLENPAKMAKEEFEKLLHGGTEEVKKLFDDASGDIKNNIQKVQDDLSGVTDTVDGLKDKVNKLSGGVQDKLHIGNREVEVWPETVVIRQTATATSTAIPQVSVLSLAKRDIPLTSEGKRRFGLPKLPKVGIPEKFNMERVNSIKSRVSSVSTLVNRGEGSFLHKTWVFIKVLFTPMRKIAHGVLWIFEWPQRCKESVGWLKRLIDFLKGVNTSLYFWGLVWVVSTSLLCLIFIILFIFTAWKLNKYGGNMQHAQKNIQDYADGEFDKIKAKINMAFEMIPGKPQVTWGAERKWVISDGGATYNEWTEMKYRPSEPETRTAMPHQAPIAAAVTPTASLEQVPRGEESLVQRVVAHPLETTADFTGALDSGSTTVATATQLRTGDTIASDQETAKILHLVPRRLFAREAWCKVLQLANCTSKLETPPNWLLPPGYLSRGGRGVDIPWPFLVVGSFVRLVRGDNAPRVTMGTTMTTVTSTVNVHDTATTTKRQKRDESVPPTSTMTITSTVYTHGTITTKPKKRAERRPLVTTTDLFSEETNPPEIRRQVYTNVAERRFHAPLAWENLKIWAKYPRVATDDHIDRRDMVTSMPALDLPTTTAHDYRDFVESLLRRASTNAAPPMLTGVWGFRRYMTPRDEASVTSSAASLTNISQPSGTIPPNASGGSPALTGLLTVGQARAILYDALATLCFNVNAYAGNATIDEGVVSICRQPEVSYFTYVPGLDHCTERDDFDGIMMIGKGLCSKHYNGSSTVIQQPFKRFCEMGKQLEESAGDLVNECESETHTHKSHAPGTLMLSAASPNSDGSSSQAITPTAANSVSKCSLDPLASAAYTSLLHSVSSFVPDGFMYSTSTSLASSITTPSLTGNKRQVVTPVPLSAPPLPPHPKLTPPDDWKIDMLTWTTQAPQYTLRTVPTNANPPPHVATGPPLSNTWGTYVALPIPTGYVAPNIVPKGPQIGQLTFFNPGEGACGGPAILANELAVAISWEIFDLGKEIGGSVLEQGFAGSFEPDATVNNGMVTSGQSVFCNRFVRAWLGDGEKKVVEQRFMVRDRCTGCNVSDLDLEPDVFNHYWVDPAVGRISVTWEWMEEAPTDTP